MQNSDLKTNKISASWQWQEQSSETWSKVALGTLTLYLRCPWKFQRLNNKNTTYEHFILQHLTLFKSVRVGSQKLKQPRNTLFPGYQWGYQWSSAKPWHQLTGSSPCLCTMQLHLLQWPEQQDYDQNHHPRFFLWRCMLVSSAWEKHPHNSPTRLPSHLFVMKELISVTQIWRPTLNLLKIAF